MVKLILPVVIKFIDFLFKRAAIKEETRRRWLGLIKLIEDDLNISIIHNEDDRKQAEDLAEQWKRESQNK